MLNLINKTIIKKILMFSVIVMTGCATTQQNERVAKIDPFEPMNRAVFSFNEAADDYVIKPIAQAYKFILPEFVRAGVTNFFSNINDVLIAANNLLQAKPVEAASDIAKGGIVVAYDAETGIASTVIAVGGTDVGDRLFLTALNIALSATPGAGGSAETAPEATVEAQ